MSRRRPRLQRLSPEVHVPQVSTGVEGAARVHGEERNTTGPSVRPRVGAVRLV
jgi:hypothetical protein